MTNYQKQRDISEHCERHIRTMGNETFIHCTPPAAKRIHWSLNSYVSVVFLSTIM